MVSLPEPLSYKTSYKIMKNKQYGPQGFGSKETGKKTLKTEIKVGSEYQIHDNTSLFLIHSKLFDCTIALNYWHYFHSKLYIIFAVNYWEMTAV